MYLIAISLAWVAGIFLGSLYNIPLLLSLSGLLPLSLVFIFRKSTRALIFFAICFFTFFGAAFFSQTTLSDKLDGDDLNTQDIRQIKGQISSVPEVQDTYTRFELSVTGVKEETAWYAFKGNILILVPLYPEYHYGDKISVTGTLEKPPVFDDFDYQAYLAKKEIYFTLYHPQIEILEKATEFDFYVWINNLRETLSSKLSAALPEPQASLAQGIVLGIRSTIPDSLKTNLSITGTAHILAISGVNLSIIAGLLVVLGIWIFGRRHYIYVWLALLMICFYVLITGMQTPVIRAAIMASIFLFAELLGRQKNIFAALCLSAAIMTGINPDILFEVSFQLTFAAMIGLIFITPLLQDYFNKVISRKIGEEGFIVKTLTLIIDSLCITFGATMAVWPIIAYNFNIFSIVGPISTILITPVLAPIIILGSAVAGIGIFSPPIAQIVGWAAWLFLSYMIWVVNIFSSFPFAAFNTGKINYNLAWIYYFILITALAVKINFQKLRRLSSNLIPRIIDGFNLVADGFTGLRVKLILIPLLIIAGLTTYSAASLPDSNLHVSFLDVGEGDAVLIQNGNQNILIDGGPGSQAVCLGLGSKLPFWDRSIDIMILTHPHLDHLGGLIEVLKRYKIKKLLMPDLVSDSPFYQEFLGMISLNQIPTESARTGQKIILNNNTSMEVLNSPSNIIGISGDDLENSGIVLRLTRNQISFLFTADISFPAEDRILEQQADLKTTILKVAHHGSETSTGSRFVSATQPSIAVISVGAENTFGHPGEQLISRLIDSTGSQDNIYRTDRSGTIEFTTDGQKLWVKTEKSH
jgi:competence protein ComEC